MGCLTGAVVDLLREGVAWLHVFDFGIPADHYLSDGIGVVADRLLFVPLLGGLLLGLAARAVRAGASTRSSIRSRPMRCMAGACRLRDSLWLTFTTVISNGGRRLAGHGSRLQPAGRGTLFLGWDASSGCAAPICAFS